MMNKWPFPDELIEKINARVDKSDPDGHWIWKMDEHTMTHKPQVCFKSLVYSVQHVIYEHIKGKLPDTYKVWRTCNKPLCVNPDHCEASPHSPDKLHFGKACGSTSLWPSYRKRR